MNSRNSTSGIATAALGIVLGIIGFGLIPVFSSPFGGCETDGWVTLNPGCSVWPEIARGALLLLPIALLTPRSWKLPVFAVVVLFVCALVGGVEAIVTGQHLVIRSLSDVWSAFLIGYPIFLGGLIVLLAWIMSPYFRNGQSGKVA